VTIIATVIAVIYHLIIAYQPPFMTAMILPINETSTVISVVV